jgi:hypothetical protein
MQTVAIVLNVGPDKVAEFERGFREAELPIWEDLQARGLLLGATLSRLDISTKTEGDAVQYLLAVVFADDRGHHVHDSDPRFDAWNRRADAFQVAEPHVYGGDTIVRVGIE